MSKFQTKIPTLMILFLGGLNLIFLPVFWSFWKKEKKLLSLDQLNNIVSKREAEAEEYAKNKYFQEAKIQPFLFSENLNSQNNEKKLNLTNALKSTTESINQEFNCDLKKSQIAALLIEEHAEFKTQHVLESIAKEKAPSFADSKTINKTCERILRCKTRKDEFKNLNIDECKDQIVQRFQHHLNAFSQKEKLESTALGKNKYQNGDIHDAQFDLLHDMNQIGKVFFESFQSAPEIIYYQKPLFNARNEYLDSKTWQKNIKTNPTTQHTTEKNNWKTSPSNSPQETQISKKENNLNMAPEAEFEAEDLEIENFIKRRIETAYGKDQHLLFQNECMPIQQSKKDQKADPSTQVFSPFWDIAKENEYLLQARQKQFQETITPQIKNKNQHKSPTTDSEASKKDIWNSLEEEKTKIKQCKEKCEAKDKNWKAHYAADEQTICFMQCLCGEYTSPALPGATEATAPILEEGALKIRFCTIPAEFTDPNTGKRNITSISEILNEIHQVSKALHQGGKLSVQKITKEVLDNKHINDFKLAESMSFTLNLSTKINPKVNNQIDQKRINKLFLDEIKNDTAPVWRNSFIILASGEREEDEKNSVKNLNVQSTPNLQERGTNKGTRTLELALNKQNIANQNILLQDRFELNLAFLQQINKQLKVATQSLHALSLKK